MNAASEIAERAKLLGISCKDADCAPCRAGAVAAKFSELDIEHRAMRLGISCREYVAIGQRHPGMCATPSLDTVHAIDKMKAWIAAGQPDADLSQLEYHGHADVRAVLVATLAELPMPVQWHAIENVCFVSIGRGSPIGWMHAVRRAKRHIVALLGSLSDELPAVICHELGHSWHMPYFVEDAPKRPTLTDEEWNARVLATVGDVNEAARLLYRPEILANAMARLWGHQCEGFAPDEPRLLDLRIELTAASARAAEIEIETAQQLAACERSEP